MFYWENERTRPCTDRSSLRLEFTDFRSDLTHPDPARGVTQEQSWRLLE